MLQDITVNNHLFGSSKKFPDHFFSNQSMCLKLSKIISEPMVRPLGNCLDTSTECLRETPTKKAIFEFWSEPQFSPLIECCTIVYLTHLREEDVCLTYVSYFMQGIPFRTSHDIVGRSVALAVSKRCQLLELSLEELRSINSIFDEDVYSYLGAGNAIHKFKSYGSTGVDCVKEQMEFWLEKLGLKTI